MPQEPNPRGTFIKIAEILRRQIEADPAMCEMPSLAEVMQAYGVSRGVALRAFNVLRQDGLSEPAPGGKWRVVRVGASVDRRPLAERLSEMITEEKIAVGSPIPSTSNLAARFGVSRPTVAKALMQLENRGVLSAARQGKPRTLLALPEEEERGEA